MSLFFSSSGIGYMFSTVVSWVAAWKLYKSYKKSGLTETKIFSIACVLLGVAIFFFGFPAFFFADKPIILGWFNVAANFFMEIWLAYILKLTIMLNFPKRNASIPFYLMLFWVVFILLPINIAYLPLPTFDKYGLEIWNYEWPLFLVVGPVVLLVTWFIGGTMWYQLLFKKERKLPVLAMAIAFTVGGLGACLLVGAHTTVLAAIGYIAMFIGGFSAFATAFLEE